MGIDYTCLNCKKYNDWNCNRYNNNDLKICDDEFELDESTISQTEGMDISVMGKVYYEVHLTEDDIELVKDWINSRPKYLFSNGINCCTSMAIESLYKDGKLKLHDNDKSTVSSFEIEDIYFPQHGHMSPEEKLGDKILSAEDYILSECRKSLDKFHKMEDVIDVYKSIYDSFYSVGSEIIKKCSFIIYNESR